MNTLISIEKEKVNVLAFSIGGTIAWKFGIRSDKIDSLICVSATRLRNETIRPKGKITLYFGENDRCIPQVEWFDSMAINYDILHDKEHQFYREHEIAEQISSQISSQII